MEYLVPLLILVASVPLVVALARANELFVVRWDGGELRRVRGRIPPRLLQDLGDVLRRGHRGVAAAGGMALRGVVSDERPALRVSGELPREVHQRLRNTLALWTVAKIRAAAR
ncbi:MAG: DUF3634 family protein [Polyangiaceae bacterium]|nr:DUF3634 family protein [Polyangiaceae bacterium]